MTAPERTSAPSPRLPRMVIRESPGPDEGYGDGTFTDDGCPVEMYAAMPPDVEAARIVHLAIPSGASVLELGCGAGRIAEPLSELGHRVTGVDSSEAMLAHLIHTRPVHSDIASLELAQRFDAVLLASTLINTADPEERTQFLRAARAHTKEGGALLLERHPPSWKPVEGNESHVGPVRIQLSDIAWHDQKVMSATIVHRLGDQVAMQAFSTEILDDVALDGCLISAGFGRARRISDDDRWLSAEAPRAVE